MRYKETPRGERFPWHDTHIEQLKALLADGMSASQIANEMGGGLTRNAIIGKVARMGLAFRRKPFSRRSSVMQSKPRVERRGPLKKQQLIAIDDMSTPHEQRRTLLTLRAAECKWPVGDPIYDPHNFFFCGATQKEGSPYCPHHDRRAKQ